LGRNQELDRVIEENKMLLKQSTARNLMVFMADSSDHITGKTGLTLTITASKDGGSFSSISPTVTERGSGWYNLALTTSHTDTLGDLAVHITGTGADATDISRQVVVQIPGDVLTSNVTQINGSSTSSNLATLKLKSLDLRSNDTAVAALEIYGATGGAGLNGGKAINIQGGGAGTGGATGGAGLYVKIFGADIMVSKLVPAGTVYGAADPQFVGVMPIRSDIEVYPADEPKRFSLGWVVGEEIGIAVANPRALAAGRKSTVAG
jgi:hypothetical protein